MADLEHLELVRSGVKQLNRFRDENPRIRIDLLDADLRDLHLVEANLSGARLYNADLRRTNLRGANLSNANLIRSNLSGTNLSGAILANADCRSCVFRRSSLSQCDCTSANFSGTRFETSDVAGADLSGSTFGNSRVYSTDLGSVKGLDHCQHWAPSEVSINTLSASMGKIPYSFLRGCGFADWLALDAKLHDPRLNPLEISEIQYAVFDRRSKGFFIGGVFVSYSHEDELFADKIYDRLMRDGVAVWMDRMDMLAGPIESQVQSAIRVNDIVLMILSQASIESDWVEAELEWARNREKREKRSILCPIAVDDSWKCKIGSSVLWRNLTKCNILSFSDWKIDSQFESTYQKLVSGFKVLYGSSG